MTRDEAWAHYKRTGTIVPGYADVIAERRRRLSEWHRDPEP